MRKYFTVYKIDKDGKETLVEPKKATDKLIKNGLFVEELDAIMFIESQKAGTYVIKAVYEKTEINN